MKATRKKRVDTLITSSWKRPIFSVMIPLIKRMIAVVEMVIVVYAILTVHFTSSYPYLPALFQPCQLHLLSRVGSRYLTSVHLSSNQKPQSLELRCRYQISRAWSEQGPKTEDVKRSVKIVYITINISTTAIMGLISWILIEKIGHFHKVKICRQSVCSLVSGGLRTGCSPDLKVCGAVVETNLLDALIT